MDGLSRACCTPRKLPLANHPLHYLQKITKRSHLNKQRWLLLCRRLLSNILLLTNNKYGGLLWAVFAIAEQSGLGSGPIRARTGRSHHIPPSGNSSLHTQYRTVHTTPVTKVCYWLSMHHSVRATLTWRKAGMLVCE